MNPQEIKKHLPRTWLPFFSRFGNLTSIQELTIPHILSGENVVVAPMTKQRGFSGVFDPEEPHIPIKMEWHKGC